MRDMVERYRPREIERKWQERWERDGIYRTPDHDDRPKFYFLTMFPYTSGDLHIGHWYAMAPSDAAARYRRMRGYNVLFPMGFDAFGLPAENAAIRHGVHPKEWTYRNIERMRAQLKSMGAMIDWSREVITCDPDYYKWNQWFFLKMYERGLAYRALAPANWCPSCQTVLANEQVLPDGTCERCHTPVTRRDLEQWMLRITAYAEELLDHSKIQWPEPVVIMQKNWIGRSEGLEVAFALDGAGPQEEIRVFTTRPDTIYGVTFMVLAPEHPLVRKITTPERRQEVEEYIEQARRRTEIERLSTVREKTGVFTGAYCRNLLSGERVPIYIADYVLPWYGTGAVMGVPAHDQRDFLFAQRYGLPIKVVVAPPGWEGEPLVEAHEGPGVLVDSGPFTGMDSEKAKEAICSYVEEKGWGRRRVTYRLRDWLISRQRYWGTPIPIVYCDSCGTVPVPEEQLPVTLPEDVDFRPTGESPLARHQGFVHTSCPRCGGPARRETDTMDTFVDSSWYFMRYLSPHYQDGPFDPELGRLWLPVDQYTGGAEHAVMHLLYARFFWKVCRDLGLVEGDEPFLRLFNQGQILGPDGQRMSKSRGNVVAPDEQIERWGVDTFRCYLMFLGPWEDGGPYTFEGIQGIWRWLNRVWALCLEEPHKDATADSLPLRRLTHRTIKKATDDMERFRFNTLISALMEMTNQLYRFRQEGPVHPQAWEEAIDALLLIMAPLAPHITEELWERRGRPYSIHQQAWPSYDPELARLQEITLVVQVNGKVRDKLQVPAEISEEEALRLALESPRVRQHIDQRSIERTIYVPGRLINLVVR
jgi:leucyl-tRNA synthetase